MFEPDLLARFTTHLKETLQKSLVYAINCGRDLVEPGDLIVGLLQERGCLGGEVLQKAKLNAADAEQFFRGTSSGHQAGTPIAPDLSPAVKRLLEKCVLTAHLYEHKYVGTEHLLFAILETRLLDVQTYLEERGLNLEYAKEQLSNILKSTSKFPDIGLRNQGTDDAPQKTDEEEPATGVAEPRPRAVRERRVKALEVFTRDLTSPEVIAKLDPVIGREAETDRMIEILCRRFKNNPILLGEPGVGKTAIVEGLAQRLSSGDMPDALQGKRILAVDLALMVAGTMYRGEFEARLKQLVDEVKQDKDVILFIDEIHNIVGAGSTSGSLDAANILKPALARGEIRCIGATTWSEYKKYIEPDAALERRYQPVDILEPSAELTAQMLHGTKQRYEEHHGVRFEPAALDMAVRLAERYLTDRFFPDKAFDLLDEAAAFVTASRRSRESLERLHALEIALQAAQEAKDEAVTAGSLIDAAKAMENEQRLLTEKKQLEQTRKNKRANDCLTIKPEHVAQVVARISRLPLAALLATERESLADLETRLMQSVIGQTAAVSAVSETVRRARLGLSDPLRPRASFLFVGPSGVGKTELARALAREIFGREDALVKLDMSEFAEGHSVSKLLGSPAGYVGFRENNRLADVIRKRPHAVLLFDEFEKAHHDVQHLLLQALEDGRITDATGRVVPLRHAYVVLTSNVGAELVRRTSLGFDQADNSNKSVFDSLLKEQLSERFRPELLNRLDRVVVFNPLDETTMSQIIRRELEVVLQRLEETQKIAYSMTEDVVEWLMKRERTPEEGARAARRVVEREVSSLLGHALVNQPQKRKWRLQIKKGQLVIV